MGIRKSAKQYKARENSWEDDIVVELLQYLNEDSKAYLLKLLNQIYTEKELPKDIKTSVLVPLPKVKNAREHEQHRTVRLISHTLKSFVENCQHTDTSIS